MLPPLHRSFRKLERGKADMLRSISAWAPSELCFKPGDTAWSVAEVIDHMAKVEAGFLKVVREQLADPQPIALRDRFGNFMVRAVMRSRMRVKVPQEARSVLPAANCNMQSATRTWEQARNRWRDLLESVQPAGLRGGVFRHPRGGWMTLPATLTLLRLHHDHHRAQIARIRAALPPR